jgi:hypothetical protein
LFKDWNIEEMLSLGSVLGMRIAAKAGAKLGLPIPDIANFLQRHLESVSEEGDDPGAGYSPGNATNTT